MSDFVEYIYRRGPDPVNYLSNKKKLLIASLKKNEEKNRRIKILKLSVVQLLDEELYSYIKNLSSDLFFLCHFKTISILNKI